jgi:hypothetical protein
VSHNGKPWRHSLEVAGLNSRFAVAFAFPVKRSSTPMLLNVALRVNGSGAKVFEVVNSGVTCGGGGDGSGAKVFEVVSSGVTCGGSGDGVAVSPHADLGIRKVAMNTHATSIAATLNGDRAFWRLARGSIKKYPAVMADIALEAAGTGCWVTRHAGLPVRSYGDLVAPWRGTAPRSLSPRALRESGAENVLSQSRPECA